MMPSLEAELQAAQFAIGEALDPLRALEQEAQRLATFDFANEEIVAGLSAAAVGFADAETREHIIRSGLAGQTAFGGPAIATPPPVAANGHAAHDIPTPQGPEDFGLGYDAEPTPNLPAVVPRFVPVAIDDVEVRAEPAWLVHRILPARGLYGIVGAPKSGKSFLASDMLFHVAMGKDYAGRDVLPGPVMYLTGEGVTGFRRRLIAMRRHYRAEGNGVPFFMVDNVPDLGSPKTDLDQLVRDLDAYMKATGVPQLSAIALDTVARCMGEGDESQARDMSRFVARCGEIERHFGCVVVLVHHLGKDTSRGPRGSNALLAALDGLLLIEKGDGQSTATIDEMKDGPDDQAWTFRLETFDLDDATGPGAERTTCVVHLLTTPDEGGALTRRDTKGKLQPKHRKFLQCLQDAIAGSTMRFGNLPATTQEAWQRECIRRGLLDEGKPDSVRSQMSQARIALVAADHAGNNDDTIWLLP